MGIGERGRKRARKWDALFTRIFFLAAVLPTTLPRHGLTEGEKEEGREARKEGMALRMRVCARKSSRLHLLSSLLTFWQRIALEGGELLQ